MSLESVEAYFTKLGRQSELIYLNQSSATVAQAAEALGISQKEVAKTLGINIKGDYVLIVVKGDARLDNKKFKATFHTKAKMMDEQELLTYTSHPIGGVCPFGLKQPLPIYLDESLKQCEWVYPAAGSTNTAIKLRVTDLAELTQGTWVDVCRDSSGEAL